MTRVSSFVALAEGSPSDDFLAVVVSFEDSAFFEMRDCRIESKIRTGVNSSHRKR